VVPISNLVSVLTGHYKPAFTVHPHCGIATFVYADGEKNYIPVTRFIDAEGMFNKMQELAKKANTKTGRIVLSILKQGRRVTKGKGLARSFKHFFGEYIDENKCPEDFDVYGLMGGVSSASDKHGAGDFAWSTTYVGGMHFQDLYNYDIERVKRCSIHYSVPDGRIIPFCAYNCGPSYRNEIEKQFSIPLKDYKPGMYSVTIDDIATKHKRYAKVPIVKDAEGNYKVDFENPGPILVNKHKRNKA